MSLALFIDTSSSTFNILIEEDNELLFNSNRVEELVGCKDIAQMVQTGFEQIGRLLKELGMIAVNIGPGGTNSIRSGISFANSLGYSMKIPVCSFSAFETMGLEAWKKFEAPVICTAKAINGNAFVGIYDKGTTGIMKFGKLKEVISEFKLEKCTVAGAHRTELMDELSAAKCHDSEIQHGNLEVLIDIKETIFKRKTLFPDFVKPLNEASPFYYE